MIDVGQGDSILVKQDTHFMLIDGGPNSSKKVVEDYLKKQNISTIEYIIGTHADEDHIGGLANVIDVFDVQNVFFSKHSKDTKTFERFVLAVKNEGIKAYAPKVGEKFDLGEAFFTVYAPNSDKYSSTNDYSIVIKITYGDNTFMLTGDAEEGSEEEILKNGLDLHADVLKLGHHGSRTSTTLEFLKAVNPTYVIASVGNGNKYNHPHKLTMEKISEMKIPLYRTDESGTIVIKSDGKNISFNTKEDSYKYGD